MSLQQYNDIFSEPFDKQLIISVEGTNVVLTNEDICEESMSLEDSICSEENLRFGACEAKCFKIRVVNNNISFKDKWLTVALLCDMPDVLVDSDGNYIVNHDGDEIGLASNESTSISIGRFKVFTDEPTNDRSWRDLTCYDAMNVILNADVASWYNSLSFPMTIKSLRDSFFAAISITQGSATLTNDSFVTQGGFVAEGELSGKTIIEAICELNGVFGHIKANGRFEYIDITATESVTLSYYEDGTGVYSDYVTDAITGVLARGSEDDIGTSVGTTTNVYVIENNPLVFGSEGTQGLSTALTNLLNKISTVSFRPFEVSTYGNPMLTAGSGITVVTRDMTINSIVKTKIMSGIQALRDELEATSDKSQPSLVNNVQSQISRTQGKIHNLRIDVNELSSEMISVKSINKKAVKVYACTSYSTYYPSSDPQDARIRLNVPITDGSFETLGNSESTKIGITLPSDFSDYDTNERDLKIIIGSTEIIAPIYYDGSALTNQIAAKGGDIMYFNLSTDASGNYSADVIMDTTSRSLISQTAEGIELMVEQVNGVNIPVYEMTSYNYDSVNNVVTIYAEDLPFDSLIDIYNTPHRIGIKLQPMTATEKAAKKEVYLVATSDSGSTVSVTGWIYNSNNNIVTDEFDGDNIIYLEYDERTISGSDTFGFWIVTDTYSQAQIDLTNSRIVMRVDSTYGLCQMELGVNPTSGSHIQLSADDLSLNANNIMSFMSGGTITLSALGTVAIDSTNFSVSNDGDVTCKSIDIDGGDINLGNGVFHVDSSGNLTATSASLTGSLTTEDSNGNYTEVNAGRITFGHGSSNGAAIKPYAWNNDWTNNPGMSIQATGKYFGLGASDQSYIVINNGLNPDGITDGIIFRENLTTQNNIKFASATAGYYGGAVKWTVGTNDYARIIGGSHGANQGYLELATADDGNEPIYARQFTGDFATITRTATLLDGSGNTTFPGSLTCGAISSSGNISTSNGAISATGNISTSGGGVTADGQLKGASVVATTGNIIANSGNVSATNGQVSGKTVVATSGNITANSGNIVASGQLQGATMSLASGELKFGSDVLHYSNGSYHIYLGAYTDHNGNSNHGIRVVNGTNWVELTQSGRVYASGTINPNTP